MSIGADKKRILEIIDGYLGGTSTPEEEVFINEFYEFMVDESVEDLPDERYDAIAGRIYRRAKHKILIQCHKNKMDKLYRKYIWPIIVTIVFLIIGFVGLSKKRGNHIRINDHVINFRHDGQSITNITRTGFRTNNSPSVPNGFSKHKLLVTTRPQAMESNVKYTTIHAPDNGKFDFTLPDKTEVRLKPTSVLKFPINFTGTYRIVQINGEAYFRVKPYHNKLFKIVTEKHEITVKTANFIFSRSDIEDKTTITCMNGIVMVKDLYSNNYITVKSGQQAILKDFSSY